jgi:hypothetical protein
MIDLCRWNERGDVDLAGIDETLDVEQRRGWETSPKRLAPGRANAGTRERLKTIDERSSIVPCVIATSGRGLGESGYPPRFATA